MSTKQEAAMRQALERIADPRNTHFAGDAQVVAREALAEQQAAEPVSVPALVGVLATLPSHIKEAVEAYGAACARVALLATRSAPVQQAAEPVAWQAEHQSGEWVNRETPTLPSTGIFTGRIRALYAHPAPTQQPLTDEQKAVLRECRNKAMKWAAQAGIPECAAFGGIAQDLDWLCGQLGIAENEKGGAA